jgi:triacylglycerol lipase
MYDPQLSKSMAAFCELTYVQYKNGVPPANNGRVTMPPGFTQTASFTAPEIDLKSKSTALKQINWKAVQGKNDLLPLAAGIQEVYFGFAATSKNYNVIALRGTQSIFEWVMDIDIPQVPVPLVWYQDGKFQLAKVHMGFVAIYVFLADQIIDAYNQFDNNLPCYVTGHSLGAALATLTAPTLKTLNLGNTIQMYNYASPRVGDPIFVDAYNFFVPESYRVVNLADLVPMVPPSKLIWDYEHVQQEWSFLNQTGEVAGNHALIGADNYTVAVNNAIPTDAARVYPVTGL